MSLGVNPCKETVYKYVDMFKLNYCWDPEVQIFSGPFSIGVICVCTHTNQHMLMTAHDAFGDAAYHLAAILQDLSSVILNEWMSQSCADTD